MSKELKKILSENTGLSKDTQKLIQEAWDTKLNETKEDLSSKLREEYARKYEHDKVSIIESMDKFLTDAIRVELEEFAEDKRKMVAERVSYATKITEHSKLLNTFITSQLKEEVQELRADKIKMAENFKKLENFLLVQLSEEIQEFRKDKKEFDAHKVKMVAEGKKELNETKQRFIKRAATITNETIQNTLRAEMTQFADDIKASRQNDFGRRVFESFVGEYLSSHLNEGSEINKLQIELASKNKELNTINEAVKQNQTVVNGLKTKLTESNDRIARSKVLGSLLQPLGKEKRAVMISMLESVKTKDLETSFNRYLPAVLNESAPVISKPKTQVLSESVTTEKTGNRAKAHQESDDVDMSQLKILSGI